MPIFSDEIQMSGNDEDDNEYIGIKNQVFEISLPYHHIDHIYHSYRHATGIRNHAKRNPLKSSCNQTYNRNKNNLFRKNKQKYNKKKHVFPLRFV